MQPEETPRAEQAEFFCSHCLEVTVATRRPLLCSSCRIGFCLNCGTRIKTDARLCHGCGTFEPPVRSHLIRSWSTGAAYFMHGWRRQHLGKDCTHVHNVAWVRTDDGSGRIVLQREALEGGTEILRELTPEERVLMGIDGPAGQTPQTEAASETPREEPDPMGSA